MALAIAERQPMLHAVEYANPPSYLQERKDPLHERTLREEIEYLHTNWRREGLPSSWVDLPGVGFMVGYQVGFLDSDKLKKMSFEEKKSLWINTTEFSLKGWVREYLQQALVFPGELELARKNGEWRLRDVTHGGGMDLEDTISEKERKGSAKKARVEIAKPFLAKAPEGSIVVIPSPSGPSNVPDGEGGEIDFPDSHHEIMVKKGNKIHTFTVKTDFSNREHRETIKRLARYAGQQDPNLTVSSPVEDYVLSVALLNSSEMPYRPRDVVNVLRQVREDECKRTGNRRKAQYAFENRRWEEIYEDLDKNIEDLWHYDKVTDEYIQEFVDFARTENWTRELLKEALATTILRLSRYVLKDVKERKLQNLSGFSSTAELTYGNSHILVGGYGQAFEDVRAIPGCAGGGKKDPNSFSSQVDKLFNSLFGDNEAKNDPNLCKCGGKEPHFHCPGKKKDGKQCDHAIIVGEGTTQCPACGTGKVC